MAAKLIGGVLLWLRRLPIAVWLVAGGALALGIWLREHDARVRAQARSELLSERVDSLRTLAEEAITQLSAKDSVIATQQRALEAQQEQFNEIARAARKQTQVAVADLRETLDSAQKDMLDRIESGYEKQLAAKDSMFAAQVRLTNLAREQVGQRDLAIAKIQQASAVVYDAWQAEKKRASPSAVTKAVRALPMVITAVGLTLLFK